MMGLSIFFLFLALPSQSGLIPTIHITAKNIPDALQDIIQGWNAVCPKSCLLPLAKFDEESRRTWNNTFWGLTFDPENPFLRPEDPFFDANLRSDLSYERLQFGPLDLHSNKELAEGYERIALSYYYDTLLCEYGEQTGDASEIDSEMKSLGQGLDALSKQMEESMKEISAKENSWQKSGAFAVLLAIVILGILAWRLLRASSSSKS